MIKIIIAIIIAFWLLALFALFLESIFKKERKLDIELKKRPKKDNKKSKKIFI